MQAARADMLVAVQARLALADAVPATGAAEFLRVVLAGGRGAQI
jgi:hypothetical protein